jgi:hypothetical protein
MIDVEISVEAEVHITVVVLNEIDYIFHLQELQYSAELDTGSIDQKLVVSANANDHIFDLRHLFSIF